MQSDDYPHGVIPKIEPKSFKHRELFIGHEAAPILLTTFTNSGWFRGQPEAREELRSKNQKLIVANVEEDELLQGRKPSDELQRIERVRPEFYIPSDRWVYEGSMTQREQLDEIQRCIRGTRIVTDRVNANPRLNTKIIPLVKGWSKWHFEWFRSAFEDLGFEYCAYDVTQYNSDKQVLKDTRRLVEVIQPEGVLLLGRLSPKVLPNCPKEVVAASGVNQWLTNCDDGAGGLSSSAYTNWANKANNDLKIYQSTVREFNKTDSVESELDQFFQEEVNIHG